MTIMFRKTSIMPKGGPGGVAVAYLNAEKRLYIDRVGLGTASKEELLTQKVVQVTAATHTLTAKDSGAILIASNLTSSIITLPSTAVGLRYTLVVGVLPTSGVGHSFSPAALDKISGNGFTPADDKDAVCVVASDRLGDVLTIVGDGVDGWIITNVTGTWTREA
jgi:hypothetical protein